jgi:ABC-2 type transport system permease protein
VSTATATLATGSRPAGSFTGTGALLRLAWRRDRVMLPIWWLGLAALSVGSAQATRALYPDEASAQGDLGSIIDNPSVVALYGPLGGLNIDALSVFKTVMMGAVFVSILGLTVVRRHTRAEEDDGRIELVGSGAVSRRAPLAAAVLLGVVAVLVPSILSGIGLAAVGQDATGSMAFAVAWAAPGLAMVGITAVIAQVAGTSRTASGLGFGTVAVFFLLRALGDTYPDGPAHVLTWISPLGWAGRVSAYGENNLWLLGVGAAAWAATTAGAFALLDRRDLGSGLLALRPGNARAGAGLGSALGLTSRLARGTVIGWTVGLVVGGSLIASLLPAVSELTKNPAVKSMLESLGSSTGSLENLFVATELSIISIAVAAAGLALALRLAGSERAGFTEPVLATPTSRLRWYASHATTGLALPTWLMLVLGTVMGALARPVGGPDAPGFGATLGAALATLPAIWVVVGVGLALVGISTRLRPLAWLVLVFWLVVGEFGDLLGLPDAVMWLSPFQHLGSLPGGTFEVLSAVVLTVVAAGLVAVGAMAHRRRDIG